MRPAGSAVPRPAEQEGRGEMSILSDGRRRALIYGLAAAAIQTILALLITAGKLWSGYDDRDLYFLYASLALEGKVPYRDYAVEYPPLALALFLAPRAVAPGVASFKIALAVEMLLFNAATVLLVASVVERRQGLAQVPSRLAWYTVFFLLLSRLMVSRFDAAPMLLGFGASVWWFAGRVRLGGLAAALGTLTKMYPAVVPLLGSIRDLSRPGPARMRGTVVFASTLLLCIASWLGLGGVRGVSASLRYQVERSFEYGSLYSGIQMLVAKLVGAEIVIGRDHASWSSITPWSARLLTWVLPIQLTSILVVCGVFTRRRLGAGVRYSGAAVLGLIITGKVFSPQYLIWLMPYIAVLDGPVASRSRRLFAAVCAATVLAAACLNYVSRTSLWVILAYDVRNVLIAWLWLWLVFGPRGDGSDHDDVDGRRSAVDR